MSPNLTYRAQVPIAQHRKNIQTSCPHRTIRSIPDRLYSFSCLFSSLSLASPSSTRHHANSAPCVVVPALPSPLEPLFPPLTAHSQESTRQPFLSGLSHSSRLRLVFILSWSCLCLDLVSSSSCPRLGVGLSSLSPARPSDPSSVPGPTIFLVAPIRTWCLPFTFCPSAYNTSLHNLPPPLQYDTSSMH